MHFYCSEKELVEKDKFTEELAKFLRGFSEKIDEKLLTPSNDVASLQERVQGFYEFLANICPNECISYMDIFEHFETTFEDVIYDCDESE